MTDDDKTTSELLQARSQSHNPYYGPNGSLTLRKSVVAFVDILGYREMAIKATRDKREHEVLSQLHAALDAGRKWLDPDAELPQLPKDIYVIRAFTDNIVIGWPIDDDAESELGSAFSSLSSFQLEMVNAGFFVRGAISIGKCPLSMRLRFSARHSMKHMRVKHASRETHE
jgi:hypothetical protein